MLHITPWAPTPVGNGVPFHSHASPPKVSTSLALAVVTIYVSLIWSRSPGLSRRTGGLTLPDFSRTSVGKAGGFRLSGGGSGGALLGGSTTSTWQVASEGFI